MSLVEKTDQQLLTELEILATKEKEIHLEVLRYLREVERRELHLARGFPSIFSFCVRFLHFSEDEALTRIRAMHLMKNHSQLEAKVEAGILSLSVLAKAQAAFQREGKRISAEIPKHTQESVLHSLEGKSLREAEREIASFFPETPTPEKTRHLSEDNTRIEFTAGKRLFEKLEKLKQLLAHQNFSGRYDLLFEYLADKALEKLLPKNNALLPGAPQATKKGRYIPISIRQHIWQSFDQGCAFTDPATGRRCGSKHALEIDHIQEYAKGGSNKPDNLQLLCPAHNKFKSRMSTRAFRKN